MPKTEKSPEKAMNYLGDFDHNVLRICHTRVLQVTQSEIVIQANEHAVRPEQLKKEVEEAFFGRRTTSELSMRLQWSLRGVFPAPLLAKFTKPKFLFALVDLASRILPVRARIECFEPAWSDEKKHYLEDRRCYRSHFARIWLTMCLMSHGAILICQSFCRIVSDGIKRGILSVLPDALRRILGS